MNDVNVNKMDSEQVKQPPIQEELRPGQEVFYTQTQAQVGDESEVAA